MDEKDIEKREQKMNGIGEWTFSDKIGYATDGMLPPLEEDDNWEFEKKILKKEKNKMKKETIISKTKMLCNLAMGVALYVVLSMTVKIPLISHIQTDLGYIIFGVFCVLFGWRAFIVGTIGCFIESLIFSGWIPLGWILGQIFIGITCGVCYNLCDKHIKNKGAKYAICIGVTAISVAIGIIGIKTIVECLLYQIPPIIKITKNSIAALADFVPMTLGFIVGQRLKRERKFARKQRKRYWTKYLNATVALGL